MIKHNKIKICNICKIVLNKENSAYPRASTNLLCKIHLRDAHSKARMRYEKIHANTPEKKKKLSDKDRRMAKKYPEKYKARYLTGYAIKKGSLKKKPCKVCKNKKVEAHHEDYSKPLDVMWLCRKHHTEIHHYQYLKKKTK